MAAARWTRTSFGVLFTLYAAGLLIWLTLGLLIHRLPAVRHRRDNPTGVDRYRSFISWHGR
jgi:hypothetical protein